MSTNTSPVRTGVRLAGLSLVAAITLMSGAYGGSVVTDDFTMLALSPAGGPTVCTMGYSGPDQILRCPLPVYRHTGGRP